LSRIDFPVYVVTMPLNADGEGPEMDETKVINTQYEIWDQLMLAVCVCYDEEIAHRVADALNGYA